MRSRRAALPRTTASGVIPMLQCSRTGFTMAGNRFHGAPLSGVQTQPAGVGTPARSRTSFTFSLSPLNRSTSGGEPE